MKKLTVHHLAAELIDAGLSVSDAHNIASSALNGHQQWQITPKTIESVRDSLHTIANSWLASSEQHEKEAVQDKAISEAVRSVAYNCEREFKDVERAEPEPKEILF